jgi:heavy metal translocating P-type ATPase
MATQSATRAQRRSCAHCGLPVTTFSPATPLGDLFCCHACRMVAAIIGKQQQGDHTWNLLRLGIGALLAMNVMMVSLLLYTGGVEAAAIPTFRLVLLGLSAPALAILIPPFLSGAARELLAKRMSLDTLIAGGSLSAFAISAVNAVRGTGEIYFDTATMLPVLVTLGKLIEASAKTRAADLLKSMESLLPTTALRQTTAGVDEVAIDQLLPGDRIWVRPGERVAVDGSIMEGSSSIEEAAFSGEFLPRFCQPGDRVIAGTVNGMGPLLVQAEKTGEELLLHGIVEMIRDAWDNPSAAERIAERAAALFTPAVLLLAATSMLAWTIAGDTANGLLSALSILVVACPCTMGIATPLATSLAITRAAKAGIVVRGGSVMERIAKTDTIFFDKTGTITVGEPTVQEVIILDRLVSEDELLARMATLESASEHPMAKAVVAKAKERGLEMGSTCQVWVSPGRGIEGRVSWRGVSKTVTAGSCEFVAKKVAAPVTQSNCSLVDIAFAGRLCGRLTFSDLIRVDAKRCVQSLDRNCVACLLLSGDGYPAAAAVAEAVGIGKVEAPRTPAQKLESIKTAIASGKTVAMVGDGINDAPALAAAHTGIAMGAGMDLAKQAGNVVILSGDLMQIPWLIGLSKQTARIIRGNFAWSFGYNTVALAAAAAGLLHPLLAAVSMVVSSLSVLGNSLRISAFPERSRD